MDDINIPRSLGGCPDKVDSGTLVVVGNIESESILNPFNADFFWSDDLSTG